ncbi:hypothetical protein HPPN135_04430 [Helicobacter pylori Puno135]|nr:hypothetical protein HPPN135_04430 [Helicobacter pylori Puno135]
MFLLLNWIGFSVKDSYIGMYLEHYSIKAFFFFFHFGKMLSFFLILDAFCFV